MDILRPRYGLPGFGVGFGWLDAGGSELVGSPDLADPLHLAPKL